MNERILFMGTPDFAAATLKALLDGGCNVIGAVTQPDKPKGRGHAMAAPPVKELALSAGIEVYQPATLKGGAFDETLAALHPDLIVVAAYRKILPPSLISYPRLGCVNVHGSLLPRHRGAAPIQRALMEGDSETGITIMRMDNGLDTGDMLHVLRTPITDEDDFESLHDRMAALGAEALMQILPTILDGSAVATPQNDDAATYAAKIEKADCLLDLSRDARSLFLQIRALSPFPMAYTFKGGESIKIAAARVGSTECSVAPIGTVLSLRDRVVEVQCGEGTTLLLTEVVPMGKKRMRAADWINGRKIAEGDVLGGEA